MNKKDKKETLTLIVKAEFIEVPGTKEDRKRLVRSLKDEIELCYGTPSGGYGKLVVVSSREKR
ncbi:MAG: hypothetical protein KAW92_10410 [Candidatus Cloacimonetes bacterium]|nr:hypothetical protein [Candidatus Cloacimonadota bacterium]